MSKNGMSEMENHSINSVEVVEYRENEGCWHGTGDSHFYLRVNTEMGSYEVALEKVFKW